jgi:hypothetical protein
MYNSAVLRAAQQGQTVHLSCNQNINAYATSLLQVASLEWMVLQGLIRAR